MRVVSLFIFVFVAGCGVGSEDRASMENASVSAVTVLECGQLLDVEAETVLRNVAIVVEGDRIQSVEESGAAPAGARRIDLSDKVCLPGLMDMHSHVMMRELVPLGEGSSASLALNALMTLSEMLDRGFTTLRLPGDWDSEFGIVDVRDAVNSGEFPGPRLFVAGHKLGFHRYMKLSGIDADVGYHKVEPGTEGVREAVRTQVEHGVDWIKFIADKGNLHTEGVVRIFDDEEVAAFVEEAHKHETPITAHAIGDDGTLIATLAGADTIEHGFYISKETAEEMKRRGVWLVPTLTVLDMFDDENFDVSKTSMTQDDYDSVKDVYLKNIPYRDEAFKYAYEIGVKMAYGTDMIWPAYVAREFTYLVKRGVTHWDAIQMATINSAELLGMEDDLGSVSSGKIADIVALEGDPLTDISAMERVRFVMQGGRVIREDE